MDECKDDDKIEDVERSNTFTKTSKKNDPSVLDKDGVNNKSPDIKDISHTVSDVPDSLPPPSIAQLRDEEITSNIQPILRVCKPACDVPSSETDSSSEDHILQTEAGCMDQNEIQFTSLESPGTSMARLSSSDVCFKEKNDNKDIKVTSTNDSDGSSSSDDEWCTPRGSEASLTSNKAAISSQETDSDASIADEVERIEDVFYKISKRFSSKLFKVFAQAGTGLALSMDEVTSIIEDNQESIEEQKIQMLWLWKEKNGAKGTQKNIKNIVEQYFKEQGNESAGLRFEDIFMEVLRRFANSSQFKRFAMSKYGLSLSSYEVGNIIEDSKSVEERNLEMLWLWKHKNEEIATTQRVQKLVDDFLNESSDDESEEDEPGACGGVPLFEPQSTRVPEFNKATEHNISTVNTTEKQTDEKKDMKTHESNESDEVNEFKRVVNSSTRNTVTYSFKRKNLATIDFDVSPETRKIDFYGTTVKETEYKPELGFSQQTQHQPGLGCKRENFFQSPVEAAIHRVVIIGGAGYGKTEMLNGYAGDVMDQNIPLLAKVEVVLHRNFRDLEVHGKISPGKFLFGHLDMSDDITEVGVDWIRKNLSKFLLVLDGADQYSLPDQLGKHSRNINHTQEADPKLILNSILSGDLFPGIYILYSSREHAIRFFEGKTRAQKVIALAGFNKENVEKLVRGFSGERTDEIMSHLEMNSPQLLSLCSIPMFLIFTVTILLRYKDKKPETLTEVLMLVLQDSFKSEHITIDQSKTGLTIYDVMNKLKEMSYNGTKNKRVTFTKSDLPHGLTAEHFKDILITIPGSVGENQKLVEGHFIFLMQHQSLQEALTALFIAEMSLRKFKRFVSDQLYEPHWVVVRRILFGVIVNPKTSKLAAGIDSKVGIFQGRNVEEKKQILLSSIKQLSKPGWFKRKYKKIKRVQDEELVELIHTVNECGEAAKNVIKSSFQKINILDSFLTRSDVFALSSVVGRCSFIQELKVHLSIDDLEVMCSVFERCNVKIKRMILRTNLFTGVDLFDYEVIQITRLLPYVMELLVLNCFITSCEEMFQEKLNALPDSNLQIISNLGGRIWFKLRPGSSNEMLDRATYEILKKDLILLED